MTSKTVSLSRLIKALKFIDTCPISSSELTASLVLNDPLPLAKRLKLLAASLADEPILRAIQMAISNKRVSDTTATTNIRLSASSERAFVLATSSKKRASAFCCAFLKLVNTASYRLVLS